ncbi:hypothetical protein Agub_g13908, partial [Astrephomene gubernaculifera]
HIASNPHILLLAWPTGLSTATRLRIRHVQLRSLITILASCIKRVSKGVHYVTWCKQWLYLDSFAIPNLLLSNRLCGHCSMGLSQLQHWARAQVLHDRVRVSTAQPTDLLRPDVNIVHLRRQLPVKPGQFQRQASELGLGFKARAVTPTAEPRLAASRLTAALTHVPEVRQVIQADVEQLVALFGQQLGYPAVRAKLEVLGGTPCPRFHADHVGVRLLVTYCGPGTVFVENRHVRRRWLWGGAGGVAVEAVDPAAASRGGGAAGSAARQAAPGDLLFLKGNAAPGNYGMGAVHRSPDMASMLAVDSDPDLGASLEDPDLDLDCRYRDQDLCTTGLGRGGKEAMEGAGKALRLLLTIDDVVEDCQEAKGGVGREAAVAVGKEEQAGSGCGCGRAH